MTKTDHMAEGLNDADRAFLADLEAGEGFFSQLSAVFKGPMGWVGICVLMAAFLMVGLAVWFGWEAFHAPTDKLTILWSSGAIAAILGNGLLRLFLASRMSQLAILRKLRRIELRLVKLDERQV